MSSPPTWNCCFRTLADENGRVNVVCVYMYSISGATVLDRRRKRLMGDPPPRFESLCPPESFLFFCSIFK